MWRCGWIDKDLWRAWLGRLYIGVVREARPHELFHVWKKEFAGNYFWSLTCRSYTLALGWAHFEDEDGVAP